MGIYRWVLIAAAALMLAGIGAQAADNKASFAVTAGVLFPTSSEVGDDFGDSYLRFGLTSFDPVKPDNWRLSVEFAAYRFNGPEWRARLYPFSAGVVKGWDLNEKTQAYVTLRGGPCISKIENLTIPYSDRGTVLNANAAVGVVFKQRLYVEARYDYFGDVGGYKFDSVSLSLGLRLFDVKF